MAPKSLVLAALLLLLVAAGQVARGAGLGANANANANVHISGIVPCSTGNSINVATVPVFPNAGLQLVCGGKVVASATADGNGAFLINMFSVGTDLLIVLLNNQCKLVVTTPLAACNVSLASATGTLTAPLKLLGTGTGTGGGDDIIGGILGLIEQIINGIVGGVLNIVPGSFSLV